MGKPRPVIFVHGIGDSSVAWRISGPLVSKLYEKYYPPFKTGSGIVKDRFDKNFVKSIRNSCVYVTFKNHFADPASQVEELAEIIQKTMDEAGEDKVILVCHSMGGLVARKYLAERPSNHHLQKLITIGTANLGVPLLKLNYLPITLSAMGAALSLALGRIEFLLLTLFGMGYEIASYLRGVKLISRGVEAMKPGSPFLKELNRKRLPTDPEYICLISKTTRFPHRLFGGDGAISLESQKLSEKCVPNFAELNYREIWIDRPHFKEPREAEAIIKCISS